MAILLRDLEEEITTNPGPADISTTRQPRGIDKAITTYYDIT